MQIRVIVAPNQITTLGREIARLKQTRNADFWRRAPAGTWHCLQVTGERADGGMAYTLDVERFDVERLLSQLDVEARGEVDRIAAERYPLADWDCLRGFEIIEPEKRRRPSSADDTPEESP